jgi:hypothetical protein
MSTCGARTARPGLVVGFAFALLVGCGQSRVPVDLMANDPLSTEQISGLEQVDQRKDGAHTALGEFQASQFVRLLRPVHGHTVDQGMVDRVADKARRAGWTVTQVPTSGGYSGHKVIEDLDVRLNISVSFDDRRIGIAMVALNEEGRD